MEWEYPGNKPNWKTNYKCSIIKNGRWDRGKYEKEVPEYGKWLFKIEVKSDGVPFPTMGDQNNFMSGLIEVEWHNDNYVFKDGKTRCTSNGKCETFHFNKRLEVFQKTLDFYKAKYDGQIKLCRFQGGE